MKHRTNVGFLNPMINIPIQGRVTDPVSRKDMEVRTKLIIAGIKDEEWEEYVPERFKKRPTLDKEPSE